MLTRTTLPVAEIARRLGHAEPASFSAAFKRWSDFAPSDYRAQARSNLSSSFSDKQDGFSGSLTGSVEAVVAFATDHTHMNRQQFVAAALR
jgi:hypothetical protein